MKTNIFAVPGKIRFLGGGGREEGGRGGIIKNQNIEGIV